MEQTAENGSKQVVIKMAAAGESPAYPKISLNRAGWVAYGPKNLFPQEIINLNSKSPVNTAIINSTVTYMCGKGIVATAKKNKSYIGRPNPSEDWDEVFEPMAQDFKTFGGFYGQVIVNRGSKTVSIFHQDFSTVRIGQIHPDGTPKTFRISNDWAKTSGKMKPIELDAWEGIKKAKKGVPYLFYMWNYSAGLARYCVPDYFAAMEYVKADGTLGEFYNNSIENGFTPSVVIEMPSNPAKEKKEAFQSDMEDAFSGAKGASSIVILWGEGGTAGAVPKITPFNASANADIYNNVEGIVFQKIISAHNLSSPTLAGVSGSGNLSGNAAEIVDAYILYNYTVIEKARRKVLKTLNVFTKLNGSAELLIDDLDVLSKIGETTNPEAIPSKTSEGDASSLASEIGVGGTQAMTAIIENPNISAPQKRELLKTLFALDDDTLDRLFAPKSPQGLSRKDPTRKFTDKVRALLNTKISIKWK